MVTCKCFLKVSGEAAMLHNLNPNPNRKPKLNLGAVSDSPAGACRQPPPAGLGCLLRQGCLIWHATPTHPLPATSGSPPASAKEHHFADSKIIFKIPELHARADSDIYIPVPKFFTCRTTVSLMFAAPCNTNGQPGSHCVPLWKHRMLAICNASGLALFTNPTV